jgi:hypothetical protein
MGVSASIGLFAGDDVAIADHFLEVIRHTAPLRSVKVLAESRPELRGPQPWSRGQIVEVLGSKACLVVSGSLRLPGCEALGVVIILRGRGNEDGMAWRYHGPMTIALDLRQVCSDDGATRPHAVAFFATACDLGAGVKHGAMYWEAGWPSPPLCAMMFHRDPAEFALDLGRAWREWRTPAWYCDLLGSQPWSDPVPPCPDPHRGQREWFVDWYIERNRVRRFLIRLDEPTVRRVATLRADDVRTILCAGAEDTEQFTLRDLGERGLAISARKLEAQGPDRRRTLGAVWSAYSTLVEIAS